MTAIFLYSAKQDPTDPAVVYLNDIGYLLAALTSARRLLDETGSRAETVAALIAAGHEPGEATGLVLAASSWTRRVVPMTEVSR